ncbi:spermidine/putrescine ABC family transporter [Centipeda periodontii DSM 2778]|uniref:Spermidine/putrescine ABC family transporter n=1 Tax=Centipeda periodontii DSM 2778 TaxID=888060 RepID=F5RJ09_9FIRM|nr:spermidine/putrescine ABC family transporter [Centipeda periodontii DSM 2778]
MPRDFPGMKEYALLGETLLIFSVLVLLPIWKLRSEGGSSERFFYKKSSYDDFLEKLVSV